MGPKFARCKVESIPRLHRGSHIERKWQPVDLDCVAYGLNGVEIGSDILHVFPGHTAVIRKRHRWIEPRTISTTSVSNGGVELFVGPVADSSFAIRRDVRRRQNTEGRFDRPSSGKGPAASGHRVTTTAIGGLREI